MKSNRVGPRIGLLVISILLLTALAGCGSAAEDDGSEGGVIGTGIILKGTVTDVRMFANNTLLIKSRTGEVSRAVINDSGSYRAPNVAGSPPFLLRADLGNAEYRYGIAYDNQIANVHSYTDVIMRNWFESGNGDIDFEFEQQAFTTTLPSRIQFLENAEVFFSFVRLVLDSYQLTGDQLLSGDYDSRNNNQGIDSYLRKNPMFIQDEKIALVITDPVSEKQSTTRSSFSVFELASDADGEPPEEPRSVRALPSAINEIVLVWDPATDNRGVVGYDVYREGEFVATTPYPVFVDTGLELDSLYTYEVVSIDASNNRSATSLPATSGTLGEADGTAPPAPVQLSATAKIGRMDLIWGQSEIGDVVEFDIYRGINNSPVDYLTTVTSSIHNDVTVSSGTEYCYQIVAIDAAGNNSDRSIEDCEKSIGSAVNRLNDEPEFEVPPMAGLNIPNVGEMECEDSWDSYSIKTTKIIDQGCYLIERSIEISNGGNLRLSPGTTMKFSAGTGVRVTKGGSFTSEGTKALPVVMTAQDPTPGYWKGIDFYNSNSTRNKIVNSVVEYAGSGGGEAAAVSLRTDNSEIARVDISGSVIRQCSATGIRATDAGSKIEKLDGSEISNCESPLTVGVHGLDKVTRRNAFSQNTDDWIDLGNSAVRSDMELVDLGVPYVVTDMRVLSGNLTIDEGVELSFREGGELFAEGSLSVNGSKSRPVIITGTIEEPGHWNRIHVRGKSNFRNAELLFGGFDGDNSDAAMLFIERGEVDLENVVLGNSSSYALRLGSGDAKISDLENVLIRNNSSTIHIPLDKTSQIENGIIFLDNLISEIYLDGNSFSGKTIDLFDIGVPYFIKDKVRIDKSRLTIHAGVTLHMGDTVDLIMDRGTVLRAIGTVDAPILLTNKSNYPGAWQGLSFYRSSLNSMEHVTIEFAGGVSESEPAALKLYCLYEPSLFLENVKIQDSAGWGISMDDDTGCDLQLGSNVVMVRNRNGAVYVPSE